MAIRKLQSRAIASDAITSSLGFTPANANLVLSEDSITGAAQLPTGTTAQRPTGSSGAFRVNSTTGRPEWYNTATSTWTSL